MEYPRNRQMSIKLQAKKYRNFIWVVKETKIKMHGDQRADKYCCY